jgi:hypothetical protein
MVEDANFWVLESQLVGDFVGLVGGTIIHDQNLKLAGEFREKLQQSPHAANK